MGARRAAFAAALCLAGQGTARAQDVNHATQSPQADAQTYKDDLFGDWLGVRKRLSAKGIDLKSSYVTEESIGLNERTSKLFYVHQIEFDADLNLAKLIGLKDGAINIVMVNREGHNLTDEKIKNEFRTQEVFGAGKDIRLVYLTYEQKFADGRIALLFGRTNVGQDFAYSKLFCNFQQNGLCGRPRSLVDNGDFSNFPLSAYGGRLKVKPFGGESYLQAGAFEANPRLASPRDGFSFTTRGDTGAVLPIEAGYVRGTDKAGTLGNYKIGAIYDTSCFSDRFADLNGAPLALTGLGPRRTRGRWSEYVMADQQVARLGGDAKRTVTLIAGGTFAPASISKYEDFWYAGALVKGPFPSRPADEVNFVALTGYVGDALADTEALQVAAGKRRFVEREETVYELNYNYRVAGWFHVTPGVQHIVHPGGNLARHDVTTLNVKTQVSF